MNNEFTSRSPLPVLSRSVSAMADKMAAPLLRMLSLTAKGRDEVRRIAAEGEAVIADLKSSGTGSTTVLSPGERDYAGLLGNLASSMKSAMIGNVFVILGFPAILAIVGWMLTLEPDSSESAMMQKAHADWLFMFTVIDIVLLCLWFVFVPYLWRFFRFAKANGFTPESADEVRCMSRYGHIVLSDSGLHVPTPRAYRIWSVDPRHDLPRYNLVPYTGISGLRVTKDEVGSFVLTLYSPIGHLVAKYYPMSEERAERVVFAIIEKAPHITIQTQ